MQKEYTSAPLVVKLPKYPWLGNLKNDIKLHIKLRYNLSDFVHDIFYSFLIFLFLLPFFTIF